MEYGPAQSEGFITALVDKDLKRATNVTGAKLDYIETHRKDLLNINSGRYLAKHNYQDASQTASGLKTLLNRIYPGYSSTVVVAENSWIDYEQRAYFNTGNYFLIWRPDYRFTIYMIWGRNEGQNTPVAQMKEMRDFYVSRVSYWRSIYDMFDLKTLMEVQWKELQRQAAGKASIGGLLLLRSQDRTNAFATDSKLYYKANTALLDYVNGFNVEALWWAN